MKRINPFVSFSVILAAMIGDRPALLLKEIAYWVEKNEQSSRNIKFGLAWTYLSAADLEQKFGFYSRKSISRWLLDLEEMKLVISGCYNKMPGDRTKWYTTNPEIIEAVSIGKIKTLANLQAWCMVHKTHIQMCERQLGLNPPKETSRCHHINPALLKMRHGWLKTGQPFLKIEQAIPPRNPPWDTTGKLIFSLPEKNENQKIDQQGTPLGTPPQKVAPKSSPMSKSWMDVAEEMRAYFEGKGAKEWEKMCKAVEVSPKAVSIAAITAQWAAKHQNTSDLLHWKANTGGLIGWIRIAGKAKKHNVRKSKLIGKHTYEQYRT